MPPTGRKATVHLKVPIALGGKDVIEGFVMEEGGAGIRVSDTADGKGRSQFFPGHLVEKIEHEEEEAND